MKPKGERYTLVRHTGWSVSGDPRFKRAVELRSLDTQGAVNKVRKLGGIIFDSYSDASEAEMEVNYGEHAQGIIPKARGSFTKKVQGEDVYVPRKGEEVWKRHLPVEPKKS